MQRYIPSFFDNESPDEREILYKEPDRTVTVYVWHSHAVQMTLRAGANKLKHTIKVPSDQRVRDYYGAEAYTGHAAIQVGNDLDNYISIVGGARLHTKEEDRSHYGTPDVEVKLYSLNVDRMLEFIEDFKTQRNHREIDFNVWGLWQYDETNTYNCACLVQALLNAGGILNLVRPKIDGYSGTKLGALAGSATGAFGGFIAGGAKVFVAESLVGFAAGSFVVILGGTAIGGPVGGIIATVAELGPTAGTLIGAGVGAAAGGAAGFGVGKLFNSTEAEIRLIVTPSDVANLANELATIERKTYRIVRRSSIETDDTTFGQETDNELEDKRDSYCLCM